mmetsp:Transcript_114861/g.234784  ORF Transcript_114861/g.234784 Transcript_114861/m.234784 type:complete len:507 (+) Transcript_114861:1048-2568(+)
MSLVDDLVGGADLSVGLLRQFWNVVRRSGLQILGVHGGGRIPEHLFVDGKVDGITDGDLSGFGLGSEGGQVFLDVAHLLGGDRACVDLVGEFRCLLEVVIGVGGVGEFELLGELDGGHGRFVGKLHGGLDLGHDFLLGFLELVFGEDSLLVDVLGFESLEGILCLPGPGLLVLSATLVLGIGGGMPVESVGVHLEDGGSVALSDVVDDGLSSLGDVGGVHAVDQQTGNAVVLSLFVNVGVLGDIRREGVDGTTVVDDQQQDGKVVLGGRVQQFGRSAVLGTTLTDKDNGDAVVVVRRGDVLLLVVGVVRDAEGAIQEDRLGGTGRVGELFADQGPSSLKVLFAIEDVHRSTGSAAGSGVLHEKLGHDGTRVDPAGDGVGVLTVVREFLVGLFDGVVDESGDGFLSVVQVHESTDLALHVLLVAGVFESSCHLHGLVQLQQLSLVGLHGVVVGLDFFRRVAEAFLELLGNPVPLEVDGGSHGALLDDLGRLYGGFGVECGGHEHRRW